MVEREFTVECCVRGHHVYQKEWEAEIGSKLTAQYETRPGALVQDKYAIALKQKDVIVGHIPKFLSKITYFYLKHGGDLLVEIIGKRRYSRYLPQGKMELPVLYVFETTNLEMHLQLPSLARKAMKTYNDAKTKAMDKPKKRQNKKMICIFEHYSYTKKKIDEKYFCQVLFEIINLALIINANLFCSKV